MITINIENVKSYLSGDVDQRIISALYNKLAAEVQGSFYARKANPYWDGKKHFFSKASLSFPTGMVWLVREILEKHKKAYTYNDLRIKPQEQPPLPLHDVILRPYQEQVATDSIQQQRTVIRLATGAGKTIVLSAIVGRQNLVTLILIHRQEILQQIKETLERVLQVPIGVVGGGVVDIQRITVAMVQSMIIQNYALYIDNVLIRRASDRVTLIDLLKDKFPDLYQQSAYEIREEEYYNNPELKEFLPKVQALHLDEGHHAPAETYLEVANKCENAYYRYLYTATDWREDNMELLLDGIAGKKRHDIKASKLIQEGWLVPPTIYLLDVPHERKNRKGIRYPKIYNEEVTNNLNRNQLVVDLAMKAVKAGKSTLILINYIEHGENILKLLQKVCPDAEFVHGSTETEHRKKVLQEFREGSRKLIIASNILGEGVDIKKLEVLITARAEASTVAAYQALGRVLRPVEGKTRAVVVDLYDANCKYLESHASARLKIYSSEPEYKIKFIKNVDEVNFNG